MNIFSSCNISFRFLFLRSLNGQKFIILCRQTYQCFKVNISCLQNYFLPQGLKIIFIRSFNFWLWTFKLLLKRGVGFHVICLCFFHIDNFYLPCLLNSVQFSWVAQSCPTLCNPLNRSTPGLPIHHHLPEFTQTHVHQVHDAIQPSHPRSSPSPPAPNPSQHQSLGPGKISLPLWGFSSLPQVQNNSL